MNTHRFYMRSSATDEWSTPEPIFAGLAREFDFDIDVCATPENAKVERFYTIEQDGLNQKWPAVCWMNPPYGRQIERWIAKASAESARGCTVVSLLPARTDTAWWHRYINGRAEVRFIQGRITFNNGKGWAPFPSAIVIFRPAGQALEGIA